MKRNGIVLVLIIVLLQCNLNAQTPSGASSLVAQPIPDRSVIYNVTDSGIYKPLIWGLDLAWLSETNIRRGIAFMGSDRVHVVRSSFTPTDSLVNGDLRPAELATLNERLRIIGMLSPATKVVLNCDHPTVHAWYKGNALRWAQLIDVTTRRHQDQGRTVVTVSPFNEPDYSATGQGTISDFYNIAGELRNISRFDSIRISGGNTLNTDQALPWYNNLKSRLNEGNTHQLAGSFDNYANFFKAVRTNGHHATNDELHNVMEAMVGVEYGMQTGIWWGTAEYARGEFVKASDGRRLGYAEHRPNWTAASVYKNTIGKIQAFAGTSERQAVTTTYRFVSKERDVFYDGHGPQREYTLVMPGGTGYQQGQTNAERVVNITWGDDVQPVINGRYRLVNRNSGKVMEVAGGSMDAGANVRQNSLIAGATYQQWNVTPVDSRIGGDFSYFTFTAVHSGKSPDIYNWSLGNGGNIVVWDDTKGSNQQWYLEYAGEGWFFIRSRHSAKCIEVASSSLSDGANIQQWEKNGSANQQWRFIPVSAPIEFVAPSAPSNLVTTANSASVRLDWTASPDADVAGYTVFRADSATGSYYIIARNINATSFVDNTALSGNQYFYKIKAVDNSLNSSVFSNEAFATPTGNNALVSYLQFDGNTLDSTVNLNHCALYGSTSYISGKVNQALAMNGVNAFAQLPATIANHQEITVAAWVLWNGGNVWQRIFDFGNGDTEYMFLTPSAGNGQLRFAIKNGGAEQQLNSTGLPTGTWTHLAVTLGTSGACLYVNGAKVSESSLVTIRPSDFKPVLNYIGRSQFSDPLFKGYIDDFRVYNYALSSTEISELATPSVNTKEIKTINQNTIVIWPVPANNVVYIGGATSNLNIPTSVKLFDINGRCVLDRTIMLDSNAEVNVQNVPSGIYFLQLVNSKISAIKKIIIER